ncbi:MAG: sugar phosphate isomerase/epimerase [Clostridia bacterium]|nr:sugar phosphate isomerase/epimerase [Clostridia bacterium]
MKLEKIGLQLYTIRNSMSNADDIRMSFRRIKQLGYDIGQTAGCAIPYEEFGQIAREEGIEICGTHDNFNLMVSDPAQAMANHRALGTTNMGIGGYWDVGSAEAVERFIETANKVADTVYEEGFKFTYHNHSHEFRRLDNGRTAMDMLVEGLDPKKTSFVLDTYWVQHGGGDVRFWIEKLTGRIDILHLKAMGRDDKGPFITELGNDNMNWEGILTSAEKAGVKYYVVEQDSWPGDPFDSIRQSSEFLHKNFM